MKSYILLLLLLLLLLPTCVCAERLNLTKGEQFEMPLTLQSGITTNSTMWLFSKFGSDHIYDRNLTILNSSPFVVCFNIPKNESTLLDSGDYSIVIHNVGKNNIKEVIYKKKYNASLQINEFLTSPFKEISDVDINGLQPSMVLSKLKEMINNTLDDNLTYYDLTVEEPNTVITGLDQLDYNRVEVYGTTNLNVGTRLKVIWDADRQVTPKDYRINSFNTTVFRDGDGEKVWKVIFNTSIQDLPVGMHWVDMVANNKTTRVGFNVGELFKNQTPPPMARIKYLNTGVMVTPTPQIVTVEVEVVRNVTVIQTVIAPTPSFPKDPFGNEYNPNQPASEGLPTVLNTLVIIVFCLVVWRLRS